MPRRDKAAAARGGTRPALGLPEPAVCLLRTQFGVHISSAARPLTQTPAPPTAPGPAQPVWLRGSHAGASASSDGSAALSKASLRRPGSPRLRAAPPLVWPPPRCRVTPARTCLLPAESDSVTSYHLNHPPCNDQPCSERCGVLLMSCQNVAIHVFLPWPGLGCAASGHTCLAATVAVVWQICSQHPCPHRPHFPVAIVAIAPLLQFVAGHNQRPQPPPVDTDFSMRRTCLSP
ncbi:uncharacterized protein CC84DRAFT_665772 [Paraphaeosphaeria sporulosa]|uniref:Uncharacterized protein n=1 Tax=Paraphaeosphaeria sporulosa TaxID=1460663 RepID=A0A177CJ30_9PLEO|nr:uncharacterized protein CC84DRAFT_665772 [Paraphaeosphaeria sporulosa]OAG07525.1 hypothetical protein CC84DRAFT_665772 [Paraphaeosphaeria sporulosa]